MGGRFVLAGLVALVVACDSAPPVDPLLPLVPARMRDLTPVFVEGIAGQPLTAGPAVQVLSADGRAVSGVEVRWTASGGQTTTPVSATGADGVTGVGWTLPTASGGATLAAEAAGLPPIVFTARVHPGGEDDRR